MSNIRQIVGQNIRHFRQIKGITQETLAEIVDVSGSYIGYLERGEKSPSLDLLVKIARTLDVEPARLLTPPVRGQLVQLVELLADKDESVIKFFNDVAAAYFASLQKLKEKAK